MIKVVRSPMKIKLGNVYLVYYKNGNEQFTCKFIQPTRCGFNLLNIETSKCILKHHLYPSKYKNHSSGDWFWVNNNLIIK